MTHLCGMTWTVGIDEAGRGPLAGPVAVGIFAVNDEFDLGNLTGIRDSKTLTERQREAWHATITALPHARFAVAMSNAATIDKRGIQHAVRSALARGLRQICVPYHAIILLDGGLYAPPSYVTQQTIIRGDATEPLISAAAILAKVTRDRHMARVHRKHPAYGFREHKGYGTKLHRQAITEHGLSPLHRTSFCTRLVPPTG